MVVGLVALGMFLNGCYGPFYLTRKVHHWNGEVSNNKWIVEAVFLVCTWLPVYSIASLADAIIFNSVEFWTGKNPMADANAGGVSQTKRIVRGDSEAVLTRTGEQLAIQQYEKGRLVSSMQLSRQGDTTVALDGKGQLLFSAQTRPDGRVIVTDASGKQLASYTESQVRKFLASVPRQ